MRSRIAGSSRMPKTVALQQQRDIVTVHNLARLLAPDVAPLNAFEDLSDRSERSNDESLDNTYRRREPEDLRLPLDTAHLPRILQRATPEEVAQAFGATKGARPVIEADNPEARRQVGRSSPHGEDVSAPPPPPIRGPALSSDQQAVFNRIMAKYSRGEQLLEIVHGMPGTGKTVPAIPLFPIDVRFRSSPVACVNNSATTAFSSLRRAGKPQHCTLEE
jgi:hypothetical protein